MAFLSRNANVSKHKPGLLRASHSRNPANDSLALHAGSRGIRRIYPCKHGYILLITTADIRKSSRSLRSRDFFAHIRCPVQSKKTDKQACPFFPIVLCLCAYIMPIGCCGIGGSGAGMSATAASVVSSVDATDTAFCSADLVTFAGSMMPASTMSTYSSL